MKKEEDGSLKTGPEQELRPALSRPFPGPPDADEILRVAFDREAHAELSAHARESLRSEVCGVLVGNVCEDAKGRFVHVRNALRGESARQGASHVTFTQETWSRIHEEIDKNHPKQQIVGWYHSHPGFGVEFSDMDVFIHRNFFPAATQVAWVLDPLSGSAAAAVNTDSGIAYLRKAWVDGREMSLASPASKQNASPANPPEALQAVETRLNQVLHALDEQTRAVSHSLTALWVLAIVVLLSLAGYSVYRWFASENEPPRLQDYVPVPVRIGDDTVLLGVGVVKWHVPERLNAAFVQAELLRQQAEEAARQKQAGTNAASPVGGHVPAAAGNTPAPQEATP